MSAAPSWPLVIVAPDERIFRGATVTAPGLNLDAFRAPEARFQGLSPESVLQTFKTQNDARGALDSHPPVTTIIFTDCKSPKLHISQRPAEEQPPPPPQAVLSRCRPDM